MWHFLEQIGFMAEKSIIMAATTGVGTFLCHPNIRFVSIPFINTSIPLFVFGAGVGLVTSLLSDTIHAIVKAEIHVKDKALDEASMFLGAVASGVIFYGSLYLMDPRYANEFGYWCALSVGSVSELSSAFIYNMIRG